jgi:hypothetical protein
MGWRRQGWRLVMPALRIATMSVGDAARTGSSVPTVRATAAYTPTVTAKARATMTFDIASPTPARSFAVALSVTGRIDSMNLALHPIVRSRAPSAVIKR